MDSWHVAKICRKTMSVRLYPPEIQLCYHCHCEIMGAEGYHEKKRSVGILGATGLVGQRFIQRLNGHPWFTVQVVAASAKSAGVAYGDIVQWKLDSKIPEGVAALTVRSCSVEEFDGVDIIFSALDSAVAGNIEERFAAAGFAVFTNAGNHRMDARVPILIPLINPDHIHAVKLQQRDRKTKGFIVSNANCSSTGLSIALKPLQDAFGIESVFLVTLQAISGAGYPGVSALDIVDNVIPLITGEESKLELEPLKILGTWDTVDESFKFAQFTLSAQCNRVAVRDGHMACCSVKLKSPANISEIESVLSQYQPSIVKLELPSAPDRAIIISEKLDRPQPRLDRDAGDGFSVTVGRIRSCSLFDVKFVCLSHNTVIGAAGGSIMNAELAVHYGYA